ncbi:hypothetical protein FRC08_010502 [Ceratobasidium sp. 394]|nr:hypothetical protein FRC08_010502 [Ceratobasidium sp. 394]
MPRSDGGDDNRRESRRELREAIRALQADNLQLREDVQRLTQEQAAEDQAPRARNRGEANNVAEDEAEERLKKKNRYKAEAASAGRRAAILHVPFMDDRYLFDHRVRHVMERILTDVEKASLDPADPELDEDNVEMEDESNPRMYWDYWRLEIPDPVSMVREILYHMPPGSGKYWFKHWFQDSFREGYRKIRGDIVFHIAKNHSLIFGIDNPRFRDKSVRRTLPEVIELRNTFQYQCFANLPGRSNPATVFRHECVVKTVRYIYSGESAIATGERSKKARNAHSQLWHMNEVPPAVIAFAVTAIDFVLSGEGSFEKSSTRSDYLYFFKGRLEMLDALKTDHPRVFEDLIDHFNRAVLPDHYPPEEEVDDDEDLHMPPAPRGLTQSDVAFMENW